MKKKVLIIDEDFEVCKEITYAQQNETTDAYYSRNENHSRAGASSYMNKHSSSFLWSFTVHKPLLHAGIWLGFGHRPNSAASDAERRDS